MPTDCDTSFYCGFHKRRLKLMFILLPIQFAVAKLICSHSAAVSLTCSYWKFGLLSSLDPLVRPSTVVGYISPTFVKLSLFVHARTCVCARARPCLCAVGAGKYNNDSD
jgi:hypothetical protein